MGQMLYGIPHTHTRKQWNNQNVFGTFPLGTINVSKEINDVCEGILIIRYNEAIVCISLTIADFEFFDCKHNSRKYLGDPISMCRQNFINSMKTDIAIFSFLVFCLARILSWAIIRNEPNVVVYFILLIICSYFSSIQIEFFLFFQVFPL